MSVVKDCRGGGRLARKVAAAVQGGARWGVNPVTTLSTFAGESEATHYYPTSIKEEGWQAKGEKLNKNKMNGDQKEQVENPHRHPSPPSRHYFCQSRFKL